MLATVSAEEPLGDSTGVCDLKPSSKRSSRCKIAPSSDNEEASPFAESSPLTPASTTVPDVEDVQDLEEFEKPKMEYKCRHCGKEFPTSSRYHKHVKLHSDLRLFRCTFPGCSRSYKRKTHLDRHLISHTKTTSYVCSYPDCTKSFASSQKLQKHERLHDLQCNVCGKRFRKRAKLNEHKLTHGIREEQASEDTKGADVGFKCGNPRCRKIFFTESALNRHISLYHHRPTSYSCDLCDERFPLWRDLCSHKRQNHPRQLICSECGKAYRKKCALDAHMKAVHEDQVYLCPHDGCGATFTKLSNLKMHERTVHQKLRPFACKMCGEKFAMKHVLRRHCLNIHGGRDRSTTNISEYAPPSPFANVLDDDATESKRLCTLYRPT